jgi:hypothetical protein
VSAIPSKFCFGDGVDQPPHIVAKSDFSADRTREDGLCVYCKECNAARQRAWKHSNPGKVKAAKQIYRKLKKERDHGGSK